MLKPNWITTEPSLKDWQIQRVNFLSVQNILYKDTAISLMKSEQDIRGKSHMEKRGQLQI